MRSAYSQHGYTLLQMLVAIMVMSIMTAMGVIMYQYYVQQARVKAVQAALLENAHFLERFYGQRHSFKQDVNHWASLPIVQTEHFCIRLQGNPLNAESDRFMLKAVAKDKNAEPRIFKLNQDLNFFVCQSAGNTCADTGDFFANPAGNEQGCAPLN